MEEERKDNRSSIRDFLDSMHSEKVKSLLVPKTSPEAHFGFSRGGAAEIHNMGKMGIAHIHDEFLMTPGRKKALSEVRGSNVADIGDYLESRLGTDSKSGLIREIAENSNLTRKEAEAVVEHWMQVNDLTQIEDRTLGTIIVPRGR